MSDKLIILHTNDIHGRLENMARIATKIEEIREENPQSTVVYLDAGDVEDTSVRLSNLTKGIAMYRLLHVMGCMASVPGNGSILRYGTEVLQAQAEASGFPLVLANLRQANGSPPLGVETRHFLTAGEAVIGLIGITARLTAYESFFKLDMPSERHLVRDLAGALWQDGVDMVILLSHMGHPEDIQLAHKLQDMVPLIIGAHSHDLLEEGYQVGNVLIVQAGEFAEHLGRVDLAWQENGELMIEKAQVIPITADIPQSAVFLNEVAALEADVEQYLSEQIAELAHDLDYASDRECGMGNLAADALRHYMSAEIGLAVVGQAFNGNLNSGNVQRLQLWDVCDSSANPGVVELTGEQLLHLVQKGLDIEFAQDDSVRGLRGRKRGLIHLSGAIIHDSQLWIGDKLVNKIKTYRVAASDFELLHNFGYVQSDWNLDVEFAVPTIIREAVEDYFSSLTEPLQIENNRMQGDLT